MQRISFIGLILCGVVGMSSTPVSLDLMLPAEIAGWQQSHADQLYEQEGLYEYINGGAELYFSYGYRKSLTRVYNREGFPDLIVDIFDMGHSYNAYGLFLHNRETIDSAFGQGSQYSPGMLLFWKDRYFISILASPESEETKQAIMQLATYIDERIKVEGALPELPRYLPRRGRVERSMRFFYHPIWQNTFYYIADDNLLNISSEAPAVMAQYGEGPQRMVLLLVQYPDGNQAQMAWEQFRQNYLPDAENGQVIRIEDGRWTGALWQDHYVGAVFNAPSLRDGEQLLTSLRNQLNQSK
jgi:hypothetical protein